MEPAENEKLYNEDDATCVYNSHILPLTSTKSSRYVRTVFIVLTGISIEVVSI